MSGLVNMEAFTTEGGVSAVDNIQENKDCEVIYQMFETIMDCTNQSGRCGNLTDLITYRVTARQTGE